MSDVFDSATRSRIMSHIRGKDTRAEMIVRRGLFALGRRYRIHVKKYPGTPDLVLARYRVAIFVNGCFWHGHEFCLSGRIPSSNTGYWKEKIARNRENDKKNINALVGMGFRVLVIWECALKNKNSLPDIICSLDEEIREGRNSYVEFPDPESFDPDMA